MKPKQPDSTITRRRYHFSGAVQGVGFRPFIYRLATSLNLAGFVCNSAAGVIVEIEGPAEAMAQFELKLKDLPPQARVSAFASTELKPCGDQGFVITASSCDGLKRVSLPPDTATCAKCLLELQNPADRRFRYPFINCTDCGPRLTIVTDLPYDRARTSMAAFELCPECRREYEDPLSRRFHAEPNACPVCGPRLELCDLNGAVMQDDDALALAIVQLMAGRIVAIKSLGGFHLAVAADDDKAVRLLRQRKQREEKPFAVMVRSLSAASEIAEISPEEAALLRSPMRPIVLCRLKPKSGIAPSVAPGLNEIGLMLPYNPIQSLLMADCGPLVMTSGNLSDEPLCIDNREALTRLRGIVDCFLLHNRTIEVRCDDSVARVMAGAPRLLRRSRGYVPNPLELGQTYPPVVALGGQMKNTLCLIADERAIFSPHVGDLSTPKARDFHSESLELLYKLADQRPQVAAIDMHPDYYTSRAAHQMGFDEVIAVQHHHAHIVSCMAENRLEGEVLGLALDGTGYGADGRIWGGELLRCDAVGFERLGHLRYFGLPGGEKAVQEPWRTAASLLRLAYGAEWKTVAARLKLFPSSSEWPEMAVRLKMLPSDLNPAMIETMLAHSLNTPLTSSLGRLCDGVAALLHLSLIAHYEGQAPMLLEASAASETPFEFELDVIDGPDGIILDPAELIRNLSEARLNGGAVPELSASFHRAVVVGFARAASLAAERTGLRRVCLSGGCCQNRLLLEGLIGELSARGLEVYSQSLIPSGDGGLALGQAVAAAAQLKLRSSL